jgi:DNA polymerase-3 subunit alpha
VVLGPDINESQQGFAVNNKGEIRFGFSGLKGLGEAAIENIILERKKHGAFASIYDLVKRMNSRVVNRKSMESLIYSGSLDSFTDLHRAQYFHHTPGDSSNLDKILKFGNIYQSQSNQATNTLFGNMPMADVVPPKLVPSEPWSLIEKLEHEKEVTGIYMSGHPLDNYRFEMRHYGITPIADFNAYKQLVAEKPASRNFRLAGLVVDAQHRLSKTGKQFGILHLEDFTGKAEFMLWREDYVKHTQYVENGMIVVIEGGFKPRYNTDQVEFKFYRIGLLDTLKTSATKQLILEMEPQWIDEGSIDFLAENFKQNPGKTRLQLNIYDKSHDRKCTLSTFDNGFTMNDDLLVFLESNPQFGIQVTLNNS